MKLIKLSIVLVVVLFFQTENSYAQLFIKGANMNFMITEGAVVTVQNMDVVSESNILTNGAKTGKLRLAGAGNPQNINMNGFDVPNLEMDNAAGINATGNAKVTENLNFVNGHLTLNTFDFRIDHDATMTNYTVAKHVKTNFTGQLIKEIGVDLNAYEMPVGQDNAFNPLSLTTAGGPYVPNGGTSVGVRDTLKIHPQKNAAVFAFLNNYWSLTQQGINPGNLTARAVYIENNPDQVTGNEIDLRGYFWRDDIQGWSTNGSFINPAINTTGNIIDGNGDLYAMNAGGILVSKVFLQGAYDAVDHRMYDKLRTPVNIIPATDPYRLPPFLGVTKFKHVLNPNPEIINNPAAVFANQALTDNDIVDWVEVQIRKNPAPGTVISTRSALVQRDGDVVDVDGVSPLWVNLPETNDNNGYVVAIGHRNHHFASTDPVNFPVQISSTTSTFVDFTTLPPNQIHGNDNLPQPITKAYVIAADGRNNLWGGNANFGTAQLQNIKIDYNANDNDRLKILETLDNNPGGNKIDLYTSADVNMDSNVFYNGNPNINDRLWLLNIPLLSEPGGGRLQYLP